MKSRDTIIDQVFREAKIDPNSFKDIALVIELMHIAMKEYHAQWLLSQQTKPEKTAGKNDGTKCNDDGYYHLELNMLISRKAEMKMDEVVNTLFKSLDDGETQICAFPTYQHPDPSSSLRGALEKIANPIKFLEDEAKAEGCQLNGMMALQLCNNAEWLKGIAKAALNNTDQSKIDKP